MKIRNIELLSARAGYNELLSKELPTKTSLALVAQSRLVNTALENVSEVQKKVIKDYELDNLGKTKDPGRQLDADTAWMELLEAEVDVPTELITISGMFRGQDIGIKPATIVQLEKLVKIEPAKDGV